MLKVFNPGVKSVPTMIFFWDKTRNALALSAIVDMISFDMEELRIIESVVVGVGEILGVMCRHGRGICSRAIIAREKYHSRGNMAMQRPVSVLVFP